MIRSNPFQYPYTNGQTMSHIQTNSATTEPEIIITDNIRPIITYPFNLETNGITQIELKLENTTISIGNLQIVADKPIFIQCIGSNLRIWNIKIYPNNTIGTKGNIYVDNYNIVDFDNNNIKSAYMYHYTSWSMPKMNPIQKIILNGNSNTINLNQYLDNDTSMKIFGENNVGINKDCISRTYCNLNIYTTHSIINFFNGVCDNLKLEIKGIGQITDINVTKTANVSIIGSTIQQVNISDDTVCTESVNGTGKIIWIR